MAKQSGIDYVDYSVNFWRGCRPVSAGCDHCYARRDMKRYGLDHSKIVRTKPATWKKINKFEPGSRVFVCPWSDFWIEDADDWRSAAWDYIRNRPDLVWIIPTKRPENIMYRLPGAWATEGLPWPNVWLLVTVESQEYEKRILDLLNIPAAVRGVSYEPALGPLDLSSIDTGLTWPFCSETSKCNALWGHTASRRASDGKKGGRFIDTIDGKTIDWVVAGSESGGKRRPAELVWFRDVRDQCQAAGVPFFLKQAEINGQLVKMPALDGVRYAQFPG